MHIIFFGTKLSPKLRIDPPRRAPKMRSEFSLVAIIKNEARYIDDWLRFHAICGFDHAYLYDNGSTDQCTDIALSCGHMNVTIIPWELHVITACRQVQVPRQSLAYAHAIQTFGGASRYMALIDTDEFIVPTQHKDISSVVRDAHYPSNIQLSWTMFGHSGYQSRPTIPVPFAYTSSTSSENESLKNVKTIIDPTSVTQIGVHKCQTRTTAAVSGSNIGLALHHYYLKSREDLAQKLATPGLSGTRIDDRAKSILEKAGHIEQSPIPNTDALNFLERHGILNPNEFATWSPNVKEKHT